jgi:hypothetical protein
MTTQSLLGFVPEQHFAVTATEQEGEPVEVGAQLNGVVGTASHEAAQRLAESIGVSREPIVQKLKQLGALGSVAGVQVYSEAWWAPSSVSGQSQTSGEPGPRSVARPVSPHARGRRATGSAHPRPVAVRQCPLAAITASPPAAHRPGW